MAFIKREQFIHKHDQRNTRVKDLIEYQLKYPDVDDVMMNRYVLGIIPTVGHITEAYMEHLYTLLNSKAVEGNIKVLTEDINLMKNVGLWDSDVERSIIDYQTKKKKLHEMMKMLPPKEKQKYINEQYKELEKLLKECAL